MIGGLCFVCVFQKTVNFLPLASVFWGQPSFDEEKRHIKKYTQPFKYSEKKRRREFGMRPLRQAQART